MASTRHCNIERSCRPSSRRIGSDLLALARPLIGFLRFRGAASVPHAGDDRDRAATVALVHRSDAEAPLDLVIANAAVNGGNQEGQVEAEDVAFETADINYTGILTNTD